MMLCPLLLIQVTKIYFSVWFPVCYCRGLRYGVFISLWLAVSAPVLENYVSEQSTSPVEEVISEEVHNPTENGHVETVEKEAPVAELVYEVPDDSRMVVESSAKIEGVQKKSYASIVSGIKANTLWTSMVKGSFLFVHITV